MEGEYGRFCTKYPTYSEVISTGVRLGSAVPCEESDGSGAWSMRIVPQSNNVIVRAPGSQPIITLE